MPQMSPIWWLSLMILFTIIYLIININLYFYKKMLMKKYIKQHKNNMNWKW